MLLQNYSNPEVQDSNLFWNTVDTKEQAHGQ